MRSILYYYIIIFIMPVILLSCSNNKPQTQIQPISKDEQAISPSSSEQIPSNTQSTSPPIQIPQYPTVTISTGNQGTTFGNQDFLGQLLNEFLSILNIGNGSTTTGGSSGILGGSGILDFFKQLFSGGSGSGIGSLFSSNSLDCGSTSSSYNSSSCNSSSDILSSSLQSSSDISSSTFSSQSGAGGTIFDDSTKSTDFDASSFISTGGGGCINGTCPLYQ